MRASRVIKDHIITYKVLYPRQLEKFGNPRSFRYQNRMSKDLQYRTRVQQAFGIYVHNLALQSFPPTRSHTLICTFILIPRRGGTVAVRGTASLGDVHDMRIFP